MELKDMRVNMSPVWVCHRFQPIRLFHHFHSAKLLNDSGDIGASMVLSFTDLCIWPRVRMV